MNIDVRKNREHGDGGWPSFDMELNWSNLVEASKCMQIFANFSLWLAQ